MFAYPVTSIPDTLERMFVFGKARRYSFDYLVTRNQQPPTFGFAP
jgi:hypothetical protein